MLNTKVHDFVVIIYDGVWALYMHYNIVLSWFVVFCTELIYSVACYVQFVIGHDESNAKGVWIAKYLKKISRCVHQCVGVGGGERDYELAQQLLLIILADM